MAKLTDIRPQVKNANRHTPRGMKALEESIQQDGWIGAITVAADGETFDGSARIEVGAATGFDAAIVVESDGSKPVVVKRTDIPSADDPRAKRLGVAANRVAQIDLAWDGAVLADLAQEIDLSGLFDDDELAAVLCEAEIMPGGGGDEFDTTPEDGPTRAQPGDLWVIGGVHRLLVGDCTDPANVARLMGGERAALCFTSPPYSDQREYTKDSNLSPLHLAQFITVSADSCDLYAVNLGLARKDNEIQTYWDVYIEAARAAGLKLLSWNVWDRSGTGYTVGQATAMFAIEHEWIFVFGERRLELNRTVPNKYASQTATGTRRDADGSTVRFTPMAIRSFRQLGTISKVVAAKGDKGDLDHPAMFPIELPSMYLEACTDLNDAVYDPFLGSGTTLIAAHRTGRRCYGCEIAPRYSDVVLRRAEAEGLTAERVDG